MAIKTKQKTISCNPYYLRDLWSKEMIDSFKIIITRLSNEYANGKTLDWEIKEKFIRNPRTRKVVRKEAVLTIKWKEEE